MDPIEVPLKLVLDPASLEQLKAQVYSTFQGAGPGGSSGGGTSGGPSDMDRERARAQHEAARGSGTRAREMWDKIGASGSGGIISLGGKKSSNVGGEAWQKMLSRMSPEDRAFYEKGKSGQSELKGDATKLLTTATSVSDKAEKAAAKVMRDKATFMKDISFLMMPLMNPGSVWATLFSTRQTFSALSGTAMGRKMSGGTLGGAGLMTAGLVAGATALGIAFMSLKKSVEGTMAAYENARKEYAKSLMSGGLPLSFTVRRGALADVLGVSEKDVFQFGRQIQYLNDKLAFSNSVIAKTTPALTGVAWEFKILEKNMAAIFASLSNEAAPAMLGFSRAMNLMVTGLGKAQWAITAIGAGMKETFWLAVSQVLGPTATNLVRNALGAAGSSAEKVPQPLAYMKQLGASPWERMGLVIGGAGTHNPQAQTARNTAATVKVLHGIRQALQPRSGSFTTNPAYSMP